MTAVIDRRPRHPWSLQTRLMVTVIGMVALILVASAFAISAILGNILATNLDNKVRETTARTVGQMRPSIVGPTAYSTLQTAPVEPGFLLYLESANGRDAAYVDSEGTVHHLTSTQLNELDVTARQPDPTTVAIDGLGTYRVSTFTVAGQYIIVGGLPLSEVNSVIAQILTTVALVTAGGLLLLGVAIALIIRRGLQPLRAVADTATRVAAVPMAEGSVSISERVPDAQSDDRTEIGRVGAALNTLLDHVGTSLEARQRNEERMRAFVADASHELRTPLASIRGYSELSLRDPSLSETTGQSLERIQAQSLRMTTLVEDLLLLARLDEGQELVYGTVDLTQLAVEAVGDARPAGPDHNWVLDVPDEPVLISGDAARMHQVVANLLANARTHTPAGTTVTVSVTTEAKDAVLRVHDDGPGIDPQISGELFERFARADRSRARKTGGTGLGLSIAKAIVDAHHGTIAVESEPGDTTFTVCVPALPAPPRPPAAPEAVPADAEL